MGLMAVNSIENTRPLSRADLLFPFAKKRRHGGGAQPSRRPTNLASPTPPPNPEEGFKFGRRVGLIAGGIGTLGIAAGLLKPWELLVPSKPDAYHPEIGKYYPALGLEKLQEAGEFKTKRTNTKWFNFSKGTLDPKVAQSTFQFFEDLAKKQPLLEYRLGNQVIPCSLGERPRTNRLIFIIPDKISIPLWPDAGNEGSTTGYFEGLYATFVRFHDSNASIPSSPSFNNTKLAFGKVFNTEAFQASASVSSASPQLTVLMQEIIANSYGAAFTVKQMTVPYPTYSTWAEDIQFRRDPNSPFYNSYVLSEKEYEDIPQVGFPTRN